MNLRTFTVRVGEPKQLLFKGQCFDAGPRGHMLCAACDRPIRFCFTLKNPAGERKYLGPGCVMKFRRWNPALWKKIRVSKLWLFIQVNAEQRDLRLAGHRERARTQELSWSKLRRNALRLVRAYRQTAQTDFLPEPLRRLERLAMLGKPGYKRLQKQAHWYEKQARALARNAAQAGPFVKAIA